MTGLFSDRYPLIDKNITYYLSTSETLVDYLIGIHLYVATGDQVPVGSSTGVCGNVSYVAPLISLS